MALQAARAAGIRLEADGNNLVLAAAATPPASVLDLLKRHKVAVVRILRWAGNDWSAQDWQVFFEERAGVAEFDGGLSRAEADCLAFGCCVTEWLNRHPILSTPAHCTWCGKPETSFALVPFGAGENHAWLHAECWSAWHQSRQAEAATALRKMGIAPGGS